MIVIADTSPLNYLILLRHVEVLRALYGRVVIPEAVARELRSPRSPELVRGWMGDAPEWLEERQVAGTADAALAKLGRRRARSDHFSRGTES